MVTFKPNHNDDVYYYKFHIVNHTTTEVSYNFDSLINGRNIVKWVSGLQQGIVNPNSTAIVNFDVSGGLLIKEPVPIFTVDGLSALFKFWCGGTDFSIVDLAGTALTETGQVLLETAAGATAGGIVGAVSGGIIGAPVGGVPGAVVGGVSGLLVGGISAVIVGGVVGAEATVKAGFGSDQYINFYNPGGINVTKDTSKLTEVKGSGFRVTLDGGGVDDPGTLDIYIQIYTD